MRFCIAPLYRYSNSDVCYTKSRWKIWWPTTVTAKPKTSRQNQKQNTSRQNQILHGKKKKKLWFYRGYLLLPWGIWFLLWSIWFCREVFGFVLRYFVFADWDFLFCREVFGFAVRFLDLPWQLWATLEKGFVQISPQNKPSHVSKHSGLSIESAYFLTTFQVFGKHMFKCHGCNTWFRFKIYPLLLKQWVFN